MAVLKKVGIELSIHMNADVHMCTATCCTRASTQEILSFHLSCERIMRVDTTSTPQNVIIPSSIHRLAN